MKGGTTNLICVELTANKPQADPLIATETPFSSIGKGGVRFDSDALALLTVALPGARLTLACATANSPAANPIGTVIGLADGLGEGLGLELGLGEGLTDGLGVAVGLATGTLIKLAPVSRDSVPGDSVVMLGNN
jgi:hypothetical protein